jgi:hypothetical protein
MEKICAKIRWLSAKEGGRKERLPDGCRYFPTIILKCDPTQTHWSTEFVVAPISADGISRIKFSLLIDNPETRVVENQLTKGTEFVFCEGARIVAVGIVI